MIKEVYAAGPVSIGTNFGFGNIISLGEGLDRIVPLAFAIASLMLVFYFLIGAFELIYSSGDKNAIASAQAKITHAIIGFGLLIFVFLVLQFLPEALLGGYAKFKIIQ